ncbi:MAG: N-acetyltransferase [Lachnospiraceae bacterium]|nr:N-acetyltransferase [Lachnospiraceae bacterium]
METEADYHATEAMTQRAFWNLHHKGCDEHYLVHKMRQHPAYLPELSRIAVKDGEVIGCICYCKSWLEKDGVRTEVTNFGPLCVDPRYQGMGVGELLLAETIPLAKAAGFPGILIFGEPGYYPLHGFVTSDKFGITNFYGENFDAFMAYELIPGALSAIGGRFVEPDVFENLPKEEVEEYNKKFPYMEKQYFPMQWD